MYIEKEVLAKTRAPFFMAKRVDSTSETMRLDAMEDGSPKNSHTNRKAKVGEWGSVVVKVPRY